MQLEDYFEFDERSGAIRIKGHRVWPEHVVERFQRGYEPERIHEELDTLSLEEIYAAILYYLHNKDAVERYLADLEAFVAERVRQWEANRSPASLRMQALFERMREQQQHEDQVPAR
jgi:uncharacterized protein (DUF433 family)